MSDIENPLFSMQPLTAPTGEIFHFNNTKEVVLDCLKIIAHKGSYELGAERAFNAICKKYGIDVSYTEMADLPLDGE